MNRLPDFIIIGAMKCATSTLHDQLARQPGMFLSDPKEPNFFSDDSVYAQGLDGYTRLFDAAAPDDLCGESSTHYTKRPALPHTLERMKPVLPHVRLIYVMRHPIDRLVSHYVHEWTENRIHGPIDRAVERFPDLVDFSRYSMQLEPYLDAYGFDNVLPVFYEYMIKHPQETIERIGRFLGYPGTPRWDPEQKARNVGAERLRKTPLSIFLTSNPALQTLRRRLLPQAWRDRAKTLWQMRRKPQLSPDVLARLRDTLDPDLQRLGSWLGVPLSCDTFRQTVTAGPLDWTVLAAAGGGIGP